VQPEQNGHIDKGQKENCIENDKFFRKERLGFHVVLVILKSSKSLSLLTLT
jgi:hypothetical protein